MKVTWGLETIDENQSSITTLGSFDGVHRGHVQILEKLVAQKRTLGLDRSVVLTFNPHPQQVLQKTGSAVQLLTTVDERLELLARTGVDEVVVIQFTPEFSRLTYVDFFESILLPKLNTKAMVVGFNHAFGRNREGDIEHLEVLGKKFEVPIIKTGPCLYDGANISSTRIRKAILSGDIQFAARCLGRSYSFKGFVVSGDHIGQTLGYPTANLSVPPEKLLPGDGVFACSVNLSGRRVLGAMSIGSRPTIGEDLERAVEIFLFDFSEEIYGAKLEVTCVERLRSQIRFDTLEELRKQILADVEECRKLFTCETLIV